MNPFTTERSALLQKLESVQPGLSTRDIVEQSSCFVFRDGKVVAFNDEVAVTRKSGLPKEFTGAVQAKPLLSMLTRFVDDSLEITPTENELQLKGKGGRKCGIRMEAEITLPIETVEAPPKESWKELPADFSEAVNIVQEGAGKNEDEEVLTCIHLTSKFIETSDQFQVIRYKIKMPLEKSLLVRRDSLKHIVPLDMTEFCVTSTWIHFRNPAGIMLSCRLYAEDANGFPDLTPYLEVPDGKPATLPKGLVQALETANEFSSEIAESNMVQVSLTQGKIKIKGQGLSGWYVEPKKIAYDGPTLMFQISPKQLMMIVEKYNDCVVSPTRLKVSGGKWSYITVLGVIEDKPEGDEE